MYVMLSLMMSMSSSSCRVSNRFLNSSRNSIFFGPIYLVSILGDFLVITVFLSTSMSSLMLLIAILKSIPMLTWLMTVTSLTICDLFLGCSQFRSSLHRLGSYSTISSLLSSEPLFRTFFIFPFYHGIASFESQSEPKPFP